MLDLIIVNNRTIKACLFLLLTIIIWFSSCETKHERLISFHSQYSHDFSEKESDDPEYYPSTTIVSQVQASDTLIIEVNLPFSGCADLKGNIYIRNDSLILTYKLNSETLCTEQIHYILTYKIENPQVTQYKTMVRYEKD